MKKIYLGCNQAGDKIELDFHFDKRAWQIVDLVTSVIQFIFFFVGFKHKGE